VATGLALLAPWRALADRSEWLLAALVALTALGIAPRQLAELRRRWQAVLALSVLPFAVLAPAARAEPVHVESTGRREALVAA